MKNKKELSLTLKSFNFFFDRLNNILPEFQKIYEERLSKEPYSSFAPNEEKQIYDSVRILYLRSINEFKNMETILSGEDPSSDLNDVVSIEILIGIGQMIVNYEHELSFLNDFEDGDFEDGDFNE